MCIRDRAFGQAAFDPAKERTRERAEDQHKYKIHFRGEQGSHIRSEAKACLLYTSPSPRDRTRSRMPSSAWKKTKKQKKKTKKQIQRQSYTHKQDPRHTKSLRSKKGTHDTDHRRIIMIKHNIVTSYRLNSLL